MVKADHSATQMFHLPLSNEAYSQFQQLQIQIQNLQIDSDPDHWHYIWGSNVFSSSKAYKSLSGSTQAHPIFKWLWKSACQNKRKVFFWLLLKDRLSTRELLRRKSMILQDYNCALCSHDIEESLFHLFFDCPFAIVAWHLLNLVIPVNYTPIQIFEAFKIQLQSLFYMEILVTMCWAIWAVRNDAIFRGIPISLQRCKLIFKSEFASIILRAKPSLHPDIDLWLEAFV